MVKKISESFGSKFLTGKDLPADDSRVTVWIHDVYDKQVGWDKEMKTVLEFADEKGRPALKPYILGNKKNATALADEYGDDPATWPGKGPLEVWAVDTEWNGEPARGVRMRPVKAKPAETDFPDPPAKAKGSPEPLDDKIPF
jgi:hypothetical protein